MSGSVTTIPTISPALFAQRIADLYPRGWCSDDAKQTGNVYATFIAFGQQLAVVQSELQYALAAQRLGTETFPELDFASIDFLGETLPRPPGVSDTVFAQEIVAALFQPADTRAALQNALTALTGYVPRMLEPWNPNDTGVWGRASYWNVDTIANPARWGDGGLRYQGFIETPPPSLPAIGANNPIQCWGTAYWNVPGYFFGIIASAPLEAINDLINRLRAFGTIVWVKIVAAPTSTAVRGPGLVVNLSATSAGTNSIALAWSNPLTGAAPFSFTALYRQSGTSGSYITGPTVSVTSVTVTNLAPGTSYDFLVQARNIAGASITVTPVTASTAKVAPAAAQSLTATQVQSTAITVVWTAPTTGTPPFTYTVNYRVTGTSIFQTLPVSSGATGVSIINLIPNTEYDIEVVTSNQ